MTKNDPRAIDESDESRIAIDYGDGGRVVAKGYHRFGNRILVVEYGQTDNAIKCKQTIATIQGTDGTYLIVDRYGEIGPNELADVTPDGYVSEPPTEEEAIDGVEWELDPSSWVLDDFRESFDARFFDRPDPETDESPTDTFEMALDKHGDGESTRIRLPQATRISMPTLDWER